MAGLIVFLLSGILLFNIGCRPKSADTVKPPQTAPGYTAVDLAKLKWIEGAWRGTGDVEKPFFERYRFESETVLAVDSFSDEQLTKVEDTTRFVLKDGVFGNEGEGSRWQATSLDAKGVTFEPVAKARNSFRWEQQSPELWIATLKWPAADGKPARERVYKMERIPPK